MSRLTRPASEAEAVAAAVHARYAEAADGRDAAATLTCFHPDATLVTSAGRLIAGHRELREFFTSWASSAPPTSHGCSEHVTESGEDWIVSSCRAVVRGDGGAALLEARYLDVLVNDASAWRIASRVIAVPTDRSIERIETT